MHLIISWNIEASNERRADIENAMKHGLNGYSWIQPLSSFYILEISSMSDWFAIQERLLSAAQNFSNEVNFIMSPVYHEETDYFVFHIPDRGFHNLR
jgi:hypothetical protein